MALTKERLAEVRKIMKENGISGEEMKTLNKIRKIFALNLVSVYEVIFLAEAMEKEVEEALNGLNHARGRTT